MILIAQLQDAGFDTVEAGNSSDADYMLASYPDVDVVIADAILPDQSSGLDFAARVITQWPGKKVVLTVEPGSAIGSDTMDGVRFIEKPFKIGTLTSMIDQLLAPVS